MKIEILATDDQLARRGAELIASEARAAVASRGQFVMAVSGGRNPWTMFGYLASQDVPWDKIDVVQVDERVAPDGDPDRNLTHLRESLLRRAPLRPEQIHAMPVNDHDLRAAADRYAETLAKLSGRPPVIDLVHLGMGPDGHTASLVPGDPVLNVADRDVAVTGVYQGRQRMTLTYPVLNRARSILWLVSDQSKADALVRMVNGDPTIPAGRIRNDNAILLADPAAASRLKS